MIRSRWWLGLGMMMLLLSGCALSDLTDSANVLLKDAAELLRTIDTKVESGELDRQLGDLLDERIEKLMDELQNAIQNGGGYLFDSANGTINLTFANLTDLLTKIKQGILDDSLPSLLENLSSQLLLHENMLSAQLQDIVALTFGNTFVLVDKTVNGLIVIGSLIVLAVGLLVFGILWFKRQTGFNTAALISLIFMGLYVLFFSGMAFITPLRGWVIAGFDFAAKVKGLDLEPKIVGVSPETFVLGKSQRIVLYGTHLNLIKNAKVALFQGQQQKLAFPANTLVETTQSRIILGNFDKSLNWKMPAYHQFSTTVLTTDTDRRTISLLGDQLQSKLFPVRRLTRMEPRRLVPMVRRAEINTVYQNVFSTTASQALKGKLDRFFAQAFQLPEGDFGIRVFNDVTPVASPQFISFFNPPPPAPKPDIYLLGANWADGLPAIKNQNAVLTVRVGYSHPEVVERPFPVRLTLSPADAGPLTLNVNQGDITAALATNFSDVRSPAFKPKNNGMYQISLQADPFNQVAESNETNNTFSVSLPVKQYVYDAEVRISHFESKSSEDYYGDEYRISFNVVVTNRGTWSFNYSKNGEPGHIYSIGRSKSYANLSPGHSIVIATSGYEYDDPDPNDPMGGAVKTYFIQDRAEEIVVLLDTGKYRVTGKIIVRQKIQ